MSIPAVFAEHFGRKYSIASRWGDYDVAKDALYDLITEFPGNDSLIFALAYFYFENQKYPNCAMVCNDLLVRNSRNQAALELSGISYENLNIKDKALQNYESLFLITNSSPTLYKMASLQYDLKRYAEAITNSDILLSKPNLDSMKVVFNDAQDKSKEYSLKAALFNLKGLTYKAQGDAVNAKKFFEEAIKVEPAFEPAKKNLASLK
jgi:tetratricopeptide (TPR) repeat protein